MEHEECAPLVKNEIWAQLGDERVERAAGTRQGLRVTHETTAKLGLLEGKVVLLLGVYGV
jgi:hypothetical protein